MIQQHPQQSFDTDPLSSSSSSQFYHHPSQSTKNHQHPSTNSKDSTIVFPHNHQEEEEHEVWTDESYYSRYTYKNRHIRAHDDNNNYDEEIVQ